ncbi:LuxR C-terminal-related transcriptional regulator [Streptomyces sp. NPDC001828]|uniref:helix-turn-helix domain-containing protein n=1 Tax=Streptomyces sp. NPDC001828 TaxID=3364615 RepID=UPI003694EE6B
MGSQAAQVTFSDRQREVVTYIAHGESAVSIGRRCFLTEYTVKTHLRAARKKLGVGAAAELVHRAYETGLIAEPDRLGRPVAVSGIEQQVLQLMSLGCCYEKIASELGKREGWVRERTRALRQRLDARNRPHLMTRARQAGLLGTRSLPTEHTSTTPGESNVRY